MSEETKEIQQPLEVVLTKTLEEYNKALVEKISSILKPIKAITDQFPNIQKDLKDLKSKVGYWNYEEETKEIENSEEV